MTPGEKRFSLLAGLAWELRRMSVGSYVTLPGVGETVLYVRCADGSRLSVLAVESGPRWLLPWSAGANTPGDDLILAARLIASSARGERAA
ncbi:hypothetical protein [Spirillospora sp. NPDC047279]|uniref:hypothetical protein n=1 Tax=Spirillospora sp. NPDC047279 TaxID=3155478 RepID=UPI0033F884CA